MTEKGWLLSVKCVSLVLAEQGPAAAGRPGGVGEGCTRKEGVDTRNKSAQDDLEEGPTGDRA